MGQYVNVESSIPNQTGATRKSYRAYLPHRLEGWEPLLSTDCTNVVLATQTALRDAAQGTQTPTGGDISTAAVNAENMNWLMARDEAIYSSVIENVEATQAGLEWARYLDEAHMPIPNDDDALTLGAAKQVLAAVELGHKIRAWHSVTLDDILELHATLFTGTESSNLGGALRTRPVWIGHPGSTIDDAIFVPPPAEYVEDLMVDLVDYLTTSTHPPALKAAIVHAQFETIHPFPDGNGRTGRALIQTAFVASGISESAVPISEPLSRNRRAYYNALNALRLECDPKSSVARADALGFWLDTFKWSCEGAHQHTVETRAGVERMLSGWRQVAQPRRDSAAAAVLGMLPSMPVLDSQMVAERLGVSSRVARAALASLEATGVVSSTGGRRNRRFYTPDVVGVHQQRQRPFRGLLWNPDADLSMDLLTTAATQPTCGYYGPRSKKHCQLPYQHKGQHRYD